MFVQLKKINSIDQLHRDTNRVVLSVKKKKHKQIKNVTYCSIENMKITYAFDKVTNIYLFIL